MSVPHSAAYRWTCVVKQDIYTMTSGIIYMCHKVWCLSWCLMNNYCKQNDNLMIFSIFFAVVLTIYNPITRFKNTCGIFWSCIRFGSMFYCQNHLQTWVVWLIVWCQCASLIRLWPQFNFIALFSFLPTFLWIILTVIQKWWCKTHYYCFATAIILWYIFKTTQTKYSQLFCRIISNLEKEMLNVCAIILT